MLEYLQIQNIFFFKVQKMNVKRMRIMNITHGLSITPLSVSAYSSSSSLSCFDGCGSSDTLEYAGTIIF
jgi:hypothetical protein